MSHAHDLHPRRIGIAATATVVGIGLLAPPASAAPGDGTGSTYANPVSTPDADTFADPAVIRGKDGYWYAYGTTDPLKEGQTEPSRNLLPILRSTDLVNWEYMGDAFTEATKPKWAEPDAALWAPDIRYVDGQYRLYYVVTETTTTGVPETSSEANDNAIGVAYSDSPLGPWVDSGDPVVDPRRAGPNNYLWTFDPHHVVGPDGREYLYFGSYYGGIFVTELNEDGSEAIGPRTMVAIDNKYEGAYVVNRGGWWYLFVSSANCCAGPTTGYSVHVGRSRSLTGPFVDREGVRLDQSRAGGTPVIAANGNTWIGTRPQRGRHRPRRPGLVRVPRSRPARPVPERHQWHQRAAHAHRPARLDQRLADGASRQVGLRGSTAGTDHRRRDRHEVRDRSRDRASRPAAPGLRWLTPRPAPRSGPPAPGGTRSTPATRCPCRCGWRRTFGPPGPASTG
jgi:hypothetical protein